MINTIVVDELIEADKETVRRLLVESYQQYEHEYSNPEAWEGYLKNIESSLDNPHVMLIRCWLQSAIRISWAHYSFFNHLKKPMKSRNLGFFHQSFGCWPFIPNQGDAVSLRNY